MEEIEYLEEYEDFILPPSDKCTERISADRESLDSLDGLYKDLISDPSLSVPELPTTSQYVPKQIESPDKTSQISTLGAGISKSFSSTRISTNTANTSYINTTTKLVTQEPLYKSSTYVHRATNKNLPISSVLQKSNKLKSVATVKPTLQRVNNSLKQSIRNDTPPLKTTTMGQSFHSSPLVSSAAQTVAGSNKSKSSAHNKNTIVSQFQGSGVDPLSLDDNDAFLDFDVDKHQLMDDFDFDSDLDNSLIGGISDLDSVDLSDEFSEGNFDLDSDTSSASSYNKKTISSKRKKPESTLEGSSKISKIKSGAISVKPENSKDQANLNASKQPQTTKTAANQKPNSQKLKTHQQSNFDNRKDFASVKSQLANKKEISIKSFVPKNNNSSSTDKMPKLIPQGKDEETVTQAVSSSNMNPLESQSDAKSVASSTNTQPESSIIAKRESDKVYVNRKKILNNDDSIKSNESINDSPIKSPPSSNNAADHSKDAAAVTTDKNARLKRGTMYLKSIKPPVSKDLNVKKNISKEMIASPPSPLQSPDTSVKKILQKDINTTVQQQLNSNVKKIPQTSQKEISTAEAGRNLMEVETANNHLENGKFEESNTSKQVKVISQPNAVVPCSDSKFTSNTYGTSLKSRHEETKQLREKNKKQLSKSQADGAGNHLPVSDANQNDGQDSERVVFSTAAPAQKTFLRINKGKRQNVQQKKRATDNKNPHISPYKFQSRPLSICLNKNAVAKFMQSKDASLAGTKNKLKSTESVALMANEPPPGNGIGRTIKSSKKYSKVEENLNESNTVISSTATELAEKVELINPATEKTQSKSRKRKKERKTKRGTKIQRTSIKQSANIIDPANKNSSTTISNLDVVVENENDLAETQNSTDEVTHDESMYLNICTNVKAKQQKRRPVESGVQVDQLKTKPVQSMDHHNMANTSDEQVNKSPVTTALSPIAAESAVEQVKRTGRAVTRKNLKENPTLINTSKIANDSKNTSFTPTPVTSKIGINHKRKTDPTPPVEPPPPLSILEGEVTCNENEVPATISCCSAEPPTTAPGVMIVQPKTEYDSEKHNSDTEITVFELPSFIVMKTKIITRNDLSSGKAYVPPLVKQKFDKLAERHVIPSVKSERPAFEDVCREINTLLDENANYLKFASGSERQARMNQVLADSSLSVEDAQCALKFLRSYLVSQRKKALEDKKSQQFIPIYDSQKKIIGYRKRTRHSKWSNNSVSRPVSQRTPNLITHTSTSGANSMNNVNRSLPADCVTTVVEKMIPFTAKKEPQVIDGGDGEIIVPDVAPASEQCIKTEVDSVLS